MKIIYKDGHVDECPQDQELHVIRHTAAHVMAQAIKRLYPQADFAFGPATENGFYYDVDLGDQKLSDEDLANIEKEMRKIVKENLPIKPFILPRAEAEKLMEERQEHYKVEHMADLADETEFSFFQQGEYVDMCIGPHLTYTKALKAFKITQQSGAYWIMSQIPHPQTSYQSECHLLLTVSHLKDQVQGTKLPESSRRPKVSVHFAHFHCNDR